jgi:branched-chain amino acid aminotransferase
MVISGSNELAPVLRAEDSSLIVYSMPLKRYIDKEAIHVCVSSWRRVADNAIPARAKPTAAYLNSALARREAFDNGFDEAILLTDGGTVSEGSAEHVFLVRDGMLVSPPSTEDNLDGITRRTVMRLAREKGFEVVERHIPAEELSSFTEVFLCGSAAEITPVSEIGEHRYQPGNISLALMDDYAKLVRGEPVNV